MENSNEELLKLTSFRRHLEIFLWGAITFAFVLVNFNQDSMILEGRYSLNLFLVAASLYTFIYYRLLTRFLKSKTQIFLGVIVFTVIFFFLQYLSNGFLVAYLLIPLIAGALIFDLWEILGLLVFELLLILGELFYRLTQTTTPTEILVANFSHHFSLVLIVGVLSAVVTYETKRREKETVRLEEVSKLKNDFIAIASHSLRTPVGAIRGYLDVLLREELGKLSGEQKKYLEHAKANNDKLAQLIEGVLNVSVVEAGTFNLLTAPLDLENLIVETLEEIFKLKAQEKGLTLTFERPGQKLPPVLADSEKIKIVFSNLLDNALKFTEKGEITVRLYRKGEEVVCEVKDTGCGISKEDLPVIFQKFTRLGDIFVYEHEGTGLGLYTVKIIIEAHKGKVWVQSEPGKGSIFSFSLPVVSETEIV